MPAAPAISAEPSGRIVALVNSTEQRDKQDDIIHKGAWQKVIASGRLPKILLGHDWSHLPVAKATALSEWGPGDTRLPSEHQANGWGALVMEAQCDMNREAGRDFHSAIAGNYLGEWSVGFLSSKSGEYFRDGARHVTVIDELPEVSGVLVGASYGTQTLATKAHSNSSSLEDLLGLGDEYTLSDFVQGIVEEETTNAGYRRDRVEKATATATENPELMIAVARARLRSLPAGDSRAAKLRQWITDTKPV
jgi:HK97 family phage prohead protease